MKRLPQSVVILAMVALIAATGRARASQYWPAHHFLLYNAAPKNDADDPSNIDGLAVGLTPMVEKKGTAKSTGEFRDGQMDWIGAIYRQIAGFRPPALDPVVHLPGEPPSAAAEKRAYAVFIFDFSKVNYRQGSDRKGLVGGYVSLPSRHNHCGPRSGNGWIGFNESTPTHALGDNPDPESIEFFDTLAHEMFHSIQARYEFEEKCDSNYWISEGMTEGVAQWMFKKRFGYELGRRFPGRHNQGMRPYFVPLNTGTYDDQNIEIPSGGMEEKHIHVGYGTASFWKFLIESAGGLKFLGNLMKNEISGPENLRSELKWLDQGLIGSTAFKHGLYAFYPEFITDFASWGGTKFPRVPTKSHPNGQRYASADQALKQWLKLAFRDCKHVQILPGQTKNIDLHIRKIAAACIRVTYTVPPRTYATVGNDSSEGVTPTILAMGHSKEVVDGIHVGVAKSHSPSGTRLCWKKGRYDPGRLKCVLKASDAELPSGVSEGAVASNMWKAARSFNAGMISAAGAGPPAVTRRIYIISNVRVKPWKTKPVDVLLQVGLPLTKLASGKPAGPPKGKAIPKRKHAKAPGKGGHAKSSTPEQAGEQRALDAKAAAMRMGRQMMSQIKSGGLYGAGAGFGMDIPGSLAELGNLSYRRSDGRKVTIVPVFPAPNGELKLGQTGPLYAAVSIENSNTLENSSLCHPQRVGPKALPVGRVLESGMKRLVVKVDTDICAFRPSPKCPRSACPKVDHIRATLYLPAGWRFYASTAPINIITPGIKDYIERFTGKPYKAVNFPTPVSPTAPPKVTHAGGQGHTASKAGGGQLKWADSYKCNCTCDEFDNFTKQTLYAPSAMVDQRMQKCTKVCKTRYSVCLEGHP